MRHANIGKFVVKINYLCRKDRMMRILLTNDDGIDAKGLATLVECLREFGELLIVAPKKAQSGMSMAVTMGYRPIAVKHVCDREGESWWYLDGTPASCIKYGLDNIMYPQKPDLVVSGVNHGSNAATASIYSATVGAAMEGAVNGIPSIAVSFDSFDPDADLSVVRTFLPEVLRRLMPSMSGRFGEFCNINFPSVPVPEVKGVKVTSMGMGHWEKEYRDFKEFLAERGRTMSPEDEAYLSAADPDEQIVVMAGDFTDNAGNPGNADHLLLAEGWITVTPGNIDNTDYSEIERLCAII